MFLETFRQDIRIGRRDLIKERSSCALAVAFFATLVPARRATRVDPMIALRAE